MAFGRSLICAAVLIASSAQAAEEAGCEPVFIEQLGLIRQHLVDRKLTAAREELEEARARLGEVECPHASLRLDLLEGQLLLDEGKLAKADERLREIELPAGVPRELETDYHYNAGSLAYELGQYLRARNHYETLLELDRASDDPHLVASDLYSIATTYIDEAADEEGREAAIVRFREILMASEGGGRASTVARIHIGLGKLLGGAEGRVHLEQGLAMTEAPDAVVTALGALAVERLEDDPDEARRLINRALAVAGKALSEEGNYWPQLYLWEDRLTVRWATLPREEAIADALATLRHIEDLRRQQDDKAARAGLFSVWTAAYQWLAGRLMEDAGEAAAQDLALSFLVMERYRARVLADSLEAAGAVPDSGAVDTEEGFFASLDDVTTSLAEDEALLVFQVAPWKNVYGRFGGGSWLMAVSRGSPRTYQLPERGLLERRVRVYLGLLAERSDEGEAAARLYQDLLAPALAQLPSGVDKLILVPDGELNLLPFGSLRATLDAPPLATRYQLSTVPSATLWQRWRTTASEASASVLVLADPLPGGVQMATLRSALGPLPFAAEEGEAVVERVGRDSLLRLGEDASEAFLKAQDLHRFGLVHFAAHAVVDDVHPELSAVLLAPGDGEDGELQAREIAELDLRGRIVVLSACRSASGSVLRGEGVMSLARAFFQAGASTVVGSLWPLDDWEAQRFFDAFYRHLARGRPVREALQLAQEELRDAGAPVAAWAGVVALGDGARAPLPERWISSPAGIGGIVVAVLVVVVLFRIVRRRRQASASP